MAWERNQDSDPLNVAPCESSKQYGVFINHRGPDVKDTLATPLYESFREASIHAYLDTKENELGDSIPSNIRNAILSASVHIAIFSPGYAESAWCLAELTLMVRTGATIIPVFCNVKPSHLRHNLGESYREAFSRFEENCRYLDHLKEWKRSLQIVSLNTGKEVIWEPNLDTSELRIELVDRVKKLLIKTSYNFELERTVLEKRNVPLNVTRYQVGLNELVEDFKSYCSNNRRERNGIVGIHGREGSGKTTLAIEFFKRNFLDYEQSSFLFDVCEASNNGKLASLQNKLLTDLFPDWNQEITSIEGRILLVNSLQNLSSFLVVIDDVDNLNQLNALMPLYNLNDKSLVIVTTRQKCVLTQADISVQYEIKKMSPQLGIKLFSYCAFQTPYPPPDYSDLVSRYVKTCQGLPLSIQVLGCNVSVRSKDTWNLELENVRERSDIKALLELCYDALEEEEKEIFLDIACLFIEKSVQMAKRLWKAMGWDADRALQTLKMKCFVDLVRQGFDEPPADVFRMHDVVRQFGTEMAGEREIRRPCCQKEKLLVLNNLREILRFNDYSFRCHNSFRDMSVTYFLEKSGTSPALQWIEFNRTFGKYSWIPRQDLEGLRITEAGISEIWWQEDRQAPQKLKELLCEFTELHRIEKVVLQKNWNNYLKSLGMLKGLESLILKLTFEGTRRDVEFEWSTFLDSVIKPACLETLGLFGCHIEGDIYLSSSGQPVDSTFLGCLKAVTLNNLRNTSKVSIIGKCCPKLKYLKIETLKDLTEVNLEGLEALEFLNVYDCHKLGKLSGSDMLKLETLSIESCSVLETLPNLQRSSSLKRFRIMLCEDLQAINGMECLSSLEDVTITGCSKLSNLTGIEELEKLRGMILSGGSTWKCVSGFERLPRDFTFVMGALPYHL